MAIPLPTAAQTGVKRLPIAPPTFTNYAIMAETFKVTDETSMEEYTNRSGNLATFGVSNPRLRLSGTLLISKLRATGLSVTADATADTLTSTTAHALTIGDIVQIGGTPPAGLSASTDYYVISSGFTSTVIKISASQAGASVNFTDAGTGVTVFRPPAIPVKGNVMKTKDVYGPWATDAAAGRFLVVVKADITNTIEGRPVMLDWEAIYAPDIHTEFGTNAPTDIDT